MRKIQLQKISDVMITTTDLYLCMSFDHHQAWHYRKWLHPAIYCNPCHHFLWKSTWFSELEQPIYMLIHIDCTTAIRICDPWTCTYTAKTKYSPHSYICLCVHIQERAFTRSEDGYLFWYTIVEGQMLLPLVILVTLCCRDREYELLRRLLTASIGEFGLLIDIWN